MKRNWIYFENLEIGKVFHFEYYPNSTKWVKQSTRTCKNLDNNRIFYVSKNEVVWIFHEYK